jgi:ribosomal protein L16 Arg81 hydroxylase
LQNKEKDKESSTPTSTPQSPVEVAPEPVKRKKRMSLDIRWNFNDLQEWFKQKNSNSPKVKLIATLLTILQ